MKKFLIFLFIAVWTVPALGQYFEAYKDTTVLPPYGIQGRIIRVSGQLWKDDGGGWIKLPLPSFGCLHKDSLVMGDGSISYNDTLTVIATKSNIAVKANASHQHLEEEIVGLTDVLTGKAPTSHGHLIPDITNLQTNLDAKLATSAVKQGAYLSDTTKFALTSHTQIQSTITGLTDSIAAKPTRTELTNLLAGKQNTIPNLADTSKYYEKAQSALVSTAELGSGSASSSTYLRGDQTWTTPSGASPYWNDLLRTDADTSNNTRVNGTPIGQLEFSVAANTRYQFEFYIPFSSAATTTGLVLYVTCPASPTRIAYTCEIPIAADGAGGMFQGWGTASADTVVGTAVQAASTVYTAKVYGHLINGANAGALRCCFKSEIYNSAITIKQYAYGRWRTF